jgi:hypothetical protein
MSEVFPIAPVVLEAYRQLKDDVERVTACLSALENAWPQLKDQQVDVEPEFRPAPASTDPVTGWPRKKPTAAQAGSKKDMIFNVVAENPGLRLSEIAEKLGFKMSNVSPALTKLVKDGKIERQGRLYYPTSSFCAYKPTEGEITKVEDYISGWISRHGLGPEKALEAGRIMREAVSAAMKNFTGKGNFLDYARAEAARAVQGKY